MIKRILVLGFTCFLNFGFVAEPVIHWGLSNQTTTNSLIPDYSFEPVSLEMRKAYRPATFSQWAGVQGWVTDVIAYFQMKKEMQRRKEYMRRFEEKVVNKLKTAYILAISS